MTVQSRSSIASELTSTIDDNTSGNITPADVRQVIGDVYFSSLDEPQVTITLNSGLNSDIPLPSSGKVRIGSAGSPGAAFSIGGFVAPVYSPDAGQPRRLRIYNPNNLTMTIVNNDASSSAGNKIKTLTGGNVALRTNLPSCFTIFYDDTDSIWVVESTY